MRLKTSVTNLRKFHTQLLLRVREVTELHSENPEPPSDHLMLFILLQPLEVAT